MVQFEELRLKLLESEKPMGELAAALGLEEMAKEYRAKLLEVVAESDDELMMRYFETEGEDFTVEEIKTALRKLTIEMKINPVVCGSSFKNKGVQKLSVS
jgi:elongation factor G